MLGLRGVQMCAGDRYNKIYQDINQENMDSTRIDMSIGKRDER